jgi:fatty-acyl-CoA synthase
VTEPANTVTDLLSHSVARVGNSPALHHGEECVTYQELEAAAKRVASGLAALGVGTGDRVAFWLPNTPAWLVLYFACARIGAIAVAVNTRYRAGEVEDVVGRTGAKVLVMWPGFHGTDFPGLLEGVDPAALERVECAVIFGESGSTPGPVPGIARSVTYDSLLNHGPLTEDRARPGTGISTFTTSGTTRAPKFVLHSNASIAVHAAEVAHDFGHHAPATAVLLDLPLTGVFGLAGAMAALAAGVPLVLTSDFDAERSLDLMRRHNITHFDGSDEMVHRLLGAGGDESVFSRINFVGFAAFNSYLDDIVERAEREGLFLAGLWGMSEMQALVARRDRDDSVEVRGRGGGRLVSPRARARVRNPQSGELCAEGIPGELEIRGPSMMSGYLDDPEATAEAVTDDGFIRTGDLACSEAGGGFHYLSRMGDVLRLGGYLVSPAEIESEIQRDPSVGAVQVVSAPARGADRAIAFVIATDGAGVDEAAVQARCADRLARYKVPERVITVDAFPVTESANGVKIQRAKLRQMALDAVGGTTRE